MSVEVDRPTIPCGVCGAAVTELRRGRCWGCYTRWAESRPVGRGACCTVCLEKRRLMLKLVEVKGRSLPFCHGCAALMLRLHDIPDTIESLRLVLSRERRVGERRAPAREGFADTDPRIRLADYEDVIIELSDIEEKEQTMVRVRPAAPLDPADAKPTP